MGKNKEFDVIVGLSHGLSQFVSDLGILERAKQREVLYKSLQSSTVAQNRAKLSGNI